MLFNSISFLYYFLPVLIIIYFITPKKYKNIILSANRSTLFHLLQISFSMKVLQKCCKRQHLLNA